MTWKTIESAPKDGCDLIGWVEGARTIITWGKCSHVPLYGWIDMCDADWENRDFCYPSLWHPLPDEPSVTNFTEDGKLSELEREL